MQQGSKADMAIHFADIVARNALMAGDYELAARNAWAMEEDEDGSRADLLETLRGIPDAHSALAKLKIPLKSLPVPEGKP